VQRCRACPSTTRPMAAPRLPSAGSPARPQDIHRQPQPHPPPESRPQRPRAATPIHRHRACRGPPPCAPARHQPAAPSDITGLTRQAVANRHDPAAAMAGQGWNRPWLRPAHDLRRHFDLPGFAGGRCLARRSRPSLRCWLALGCWRWRLRPMGVPSPRRWRKT